MKDKNIKNVLSANTFLLLLASAILIATVTETAVAKSLYVIADINRRPTPVQAYDIGADGTLAFQTQHDIPRHMVGAVGITIDSDSGYLFVTYEASDVIQLIDATTMEALGTTVAPDAKELAGIVYDHEKRLLYCVNRGTDLLYVYDWEPKTATLTHVPDSPITLEGTLTAYGIALDEIDDLLYVADRNKTIKVYSTSDWSLMDTISVSRFAISIAVDVMNGYLYTGGGYVYNNYLTQYHLATGTEKEVQVEPDAGVIGLGVDTDTGLVYVSTGKDNEPGGDNIRVYDTSLNQIDFVPAIGNPTGLAIPGKDIGYNPLNLKKIVVRGAVGKTTSGKIKSVGAGRTITYGICFDNNDNDYTVTDVFIVDTLPEEVSFVTADDDGVGGRYDPNTHTYKWSYSSLPPGSSTCLELTVLVNQDVKVGTTITNFVTINSNQTPPSTTRLDVVTTYASLNLKKSILGGVDGQVEWVDVNDLITYSIYFDNNDNDFNVTDVSIVDILPDEVNFIKAVDDIVHGQYDPVTHTYTWSCPSMPAGSANYLELVVQVIQDTDPGTIITNSVIVDSNETPPSTASVDVITYYNPLNLSKSIIGSADGEVKWVDVNETITYCICFDNNDNEYTVTNVSIVDTLPDEVSFVSADGDGVFGQYDPNTHTYTWSYSSLSPGLSTCLELVVKVNQGTAPGTTICNSVTIDSSETLPSTASVDVTTYYNPLNLSKKVTGGGAGEIEWVDVGETVTYSISFGNENDDAVTNVLIVDTLPKEVSFVSADDDGVFGQYNPATHTYTWTYPSLPSKSTICLELVVEVNKGAAIGKTISNSVTIDSTETLPSTTSADVTTPIKVQELLILPKIIRRTNNLYDVQAVATLPKGIGKDDIKNMPPTLEPVLYPENKIEAKRHIVAGTPSQAKVLAVFDRAKLLNAVPGYGRVKVKVVGKLKSGQPFYGEAIIQIGRFTGS